MSSINTPAVVMDNGTGLTKLGFAGNDSPSWVFPTAIATRASAGTKSSTANMVKLKIGIKWKDSGKIRYSNI
ncbi:unnamed protein product [[Candida] boidinii]|nr:unnamed protein product [[Candida] boidinii]